MSRPGFELIHYNSVYLWVTFFFSFFEGAESENDLTFSWLATIFTDRNASFLEKKHFSFFFCIYDIDR